MAGFTSPVYNHPEEIYGSPFYHNLSYLVQLRLSLISSVISGNRKISSTYILLKHRNGLTTPQLKTSQIIRTKMCYPQVKYSNINVYEKAIG